MEKLVFVQEKSKDTWQSKPLIYRDNQMKSCPLLYPQFDVPIHPIGGLQIGQVQPLVTNRKWGHVDSLELDNETVHPTCTVAISTTKHYVISTKYNGGMCT